MTVAIYPGTFDPVTLGHLDIAARALGVFEQLIVAVAASASKMPHYTQTERVTFCQTVWAAEPRVTVVAFDGLLVDVMQHHRVRHLVRGLRNGGDVCTEQQLAAANQALYPMCDTLFFAAQAQHCHISSSLVREVSAMGGDVSSFVPACLVDQLR